MNNWLLYVIVGLAVALIVLPRLARYFAPIPKPENYQRLNAMSDFDVLENMLDKAWSLNRYLWKQPAVLAGFVGMLASIGMNGNFAQILGYSLTIGFVVWALLSVFDLAVPFVTLNADTNPFGFDNDQAEPEKVYLYWAVVGSSVFASIVVGITSFGAIGSRAHNVNTNHEQKLEQWRTELPRVNAEISKISTALREGSVETLTIEADELKAAAEREGNRKRCGPKCEQLKSEYRSKVADLGEAKRRDELIKRRNFLREKLNTQSTKQTSVNGFARLVKDVTGYEDEGRILGYALVLIVVCFMVATPALWWLGINGAQQDRAVAFKKVMRRVYWLALEIPNGDKWLAQRFTPEELAILTSSNQQVNQAATAKPAPKFEPAPPTQPVQTVQHVTNITASGNIDAVEKISTLMSFLQSMGPGTYTLDDTYQLYTDYIGVDGRKIVRIKFSDFLMQAAQNVDNVRVTSEGVEVS